jgi:hypothetical protein
MLKCYFHSCGGWGVPCQTTLPQRMIPPPIKRSRILVSGGVEIVISVKYYAIKFVAAYPAGKLPYPDILRPEPKVAMCAANKISRPPLPAFPTASVATNFQLFTSSFHLQPFFLSNCFTLYKPALCPNSELRSS